MTYQCFLVNIGTDNSFARYIHHYKALEYFWSHFEKQDGHHGHLFVGHEAACRDFPIIPSRAKGITGSILKFEGCVNQYKSLPGNIFALSLKNKMAVMDISSKVPKEFYTF